MTVTRENAELYEDGVSPFPSGLIKYRASIGASVRSGHGAANMLSNLDKERVAHWVRSLSKYPSSHIDRKVSREDSPASIINKALGQFGPSNFCGFILTCVAYTGVPSEIGKVSIAYQKLTGRSLDSRQIRAASSTLGIGVRKRLFNKPKLENPPPDLEQPSQFPLWGNPPSASSEMSDLRCAYDDLTRQVSQLSAEVQSLREFMGRQVAKADSFTLPELVLACLEIQRSKTKGA